MPVDTSTFWNMSVVCLQSVYHMTMLDHQLTHPWLQNNTCLPYNIWLLVSSGCIFLIIPSCKLPMSHHQDFYSHNYAVFHDEKYVSQGDTLVYQNWQTTTLEQNTTTQQINGMHYASKILISVCSAIYDISTMMHHARWQGIAGSW